MGMESFFVKLKLNAQSEALFVKHILSRQRPLQYNFFLYEKTLLVNYALTEEGILLSTEATFSNFEFSLEKTVKFISLLEKTVGDVIVYHPLAEKMGLPINKSSLIDCLYTLYADKYKAYQNQFGSKKFSSNPRNFYSILRMRRLFFLS
jgi:hypothetical protein